MRPPPVTPMQFPTRLVAVAFVLTVFTFGWMGWVIHDAYRFSEDTRETHLPLRQLHGEVLRYDEILTMAARMAAATGDKAWIERYRRHVPLLDQVIDTLRQHVHSRDMQAALAFTDDANRALVNMENRAFDLVEQGHLSEAQALLAGDAYTRQKAIYADGMHALLDHQKRFVGDALKRQQTQFIASIFGIVVALAAAVVSWFALYRSVVKWRFALMGSLSDLARAEASIRDARDNLEQRVLERTEELEAAQAVAHMGSWKHDIRAETLTWSPEIFRIFGVDRRGFQPTYEAFLDTIHPDDKDAVVQAYERSLSGEEPYDIEHRITRHDTGEVRWVHEKCRHETDAAGVLLYSIGTVQDITAHKKAEEILVDAKEKAEAANHAKNDFLSVVSHELRTPLTSIMGGLKLLPHAIEAGTDHKVEKLIDVATRNADGLLRIVNQLLDISKFASSAEIETTTRVPLDALAGEAVQRNFAFAADRDVLLSQGRTETSVSVSVDEERIIQVLGNLISNAAKYSAPGETVAVECYETEKTVDGQAVRVGRIAVKDNGPGIEEAFRERIFDPFTQSESALTRKVGGTGLGLAIAKAIALAHGGDVTFETDVGKGTTFFLDLPVG